jgi:hypothetical protein
VDTVRPIVEAVGVVSWAQPAATHAPTAHVAASLVSDDGREPVIQATPYLLLERPRAATVAVHRRRRIGSTGHIAATDSHLSGRETRARGQGLRS